MATNGQRRRGLAEADRKAAGEGGKYSANGSFFATTKRQKRINVQASRLISIGKLHTSLRVHTRPIDLVIFQEPLETYV